MTKNSDSSFDDSSNNFDLSESSDTQSVSQDYNRRDALRAMGKYSAFVGTAGVVILTAEDVVAKQPCSDHPMPRPGHNCDP